MCEKRVRSFCIDNGITATRLLLAVSGGSDSIALFHLFSALKTELAIEEISIAHVNHGLRPEESAREEAFVAKLAAEAGCRFHLRRLQRGKLKDTGIEQWARMQRYTFFESLKHEFGYRYVATGHTADDQAETVLMQVSRGCGATGLCGIQPVRGDGVVRPLLQIRKERLRDWLNGRGKTWHEDPSNRDLRFKRNKIRHIILPRLLRHEPKAIENLTALAAYISEEMSFLAPLVNNWIADNVLRCGKDCFIVLKDKNFQQSGIAVEGIASVFRNYGIPFDKKDIEKFFIQAKRTAGCFLLKKGWRYYPAKKQVEVVSKKTVSRRSLEKSIQRLCIPGKTICKNGGCRFITALFKRDDTFIYDTSNHTVFLDAEKTGQALLFRPVRKSDTFQPLGYRTQVNVLRYLKKQKISDYYRRSTGVLAGKDDEIVWIPGVAIDHNSRITHATDKVFKISFERTS